MEEPSSWRIRECVAADTPALHALVGELAEYEKLAGEVDATVELFARHGFGPEPLFRALLAEEETAGGPHPLGFALYFFTFSTFRGRPTLYLEDLFVKPDRRGEGIGGALFAELKGLAREKACARMEWAVLDWNQPAIDFYRRLGARPMADWTTFRLELGRSQNET